MKKKPELLAPVGNEVMLKSAIDAGCNAVYFGIKELNMRATANNFEISQLNKIVKTCHDANVRSYLTLNSIVYDDELEKLRRVLEAAKGAKIDAVICHDHAVIIQALKSKIPVHISTQANVSNFEAVNYYSELGAKRIVLARELTLDQIRFIKKKIDKNEVNVEIETFVHGAMCVSVSGRCYTSQFMFGKSANRGDCLQPCRREYDVTDRETGDTLKIDNHFVMSPKDLCTIDFIDLLIDAGIDSFKIEGRAKNPEYVKIVIGAYKEAIDSFFEGNYTREQASKLKLDLDKSFNRGFSNGFYMGVPLNEFTNAYGGKSGYKKDYVGFVKHYYKRINVAEIKVESTEFKVGDTIMIQGQSTGVVDGIVQSIQINYKDFDIAEKGKTVAIKFEKDLRPNDKVFLIR